MPLMVTMAAHPTLLWATCPARVWGMLQG